MTSSAGDSRFDPARAALLIIDVQERLAAAMSIKELRACERNWLALIELSRRLKMPVVLSEQYPKGLGPTVAAVTSALDEAVGLQVERLEKLEFACTDAPSFDDLRTRLARDQWLIVGMEAHVCVYLTARGLLETGARVFVPADAVISRAPANAEIGLSLVARAGGVVTCTETVIFEALRRAGSDDFKAMSRLVK